MPSKKAKTSPAKTKNKSPKNVKKVNPKTVQVTSRLKAYKNKPFNRHDRPRNLVIGGIIGVFISYVIISRALNTGSYWEYFFGLAFLIVAIRLFIRSIRLK